MRLNEYVAIHGQYKTADDLNVSQAAISNALKNKREIIISDENGKIHAVEIRPFPFYKKQSAHSGATD